MRTCPQCGAPLDTPVCCDACSALLEVPEETDAFSLLGFPRSHAIDEDRLAQVFRRLTSKIHPDRHGQASDAARLLATRLTAEVNRAYAVLADPVRRADALLVLTGGPSAAEDRSVPAELLMEVMEDREALEHARTAGDRRKVEQLRQLNETKRRRTLEEIVALAAGIDAASAPQRQRLRQLLNAMRYFENLTAELA